MRKLSGIDSLTNTKNICLHKIQKRKTFEAKRNKCKEAETEETKCVYIHIKERQGGSCSPGSVGENDGDCEEGWEGYYGGVGMKQCEQKKEKKKRM